jgi:diguanylate cyclase (GGDEF)-like protein
MISDLLDQNREIETLKRQVTRDSMTQLHNHQHFRELLHNELSRAERYQRPLSLVLADIDHFKSINDTYGHLAGDHVIKAVAAKLTMEVRESDYVARYGGEEFAMILTETDSEQAEIAAERLRSEIAGLNLSIAGNSISPTMSFGISSLPTNPKIDINELINRADKALYRAKGNGRNQCCTYS